jgi:hypothetical protein
MQNLRDTNGSIPAAAARVSGRPRRRRRLHAYLIAALLVVAALLTCLSGVVATPGTTPDEDEHYAYIKHLADHYGEFPIDYANMFLYSRDHPNTATHPPLYYYILATAYRALQPNRHFTEIAREKDLYSSGISRSSVVPILRAVSWFLVFLGLLGVHRLTRYYIRASLLRPWLAVLAVALFSFIPAYTYVAGSLNNDVAVLMLWPFIVLYSTKYYLTGRWTPFWKAVFVLAAGILAKGTFWCFVLGFAALVVARFALDLRARFSPLRSHAPREDVNEPRPANGEPDRPRRRSASGVLAALVWPLLGLAMAAAAVTHVSSNLTRYGQLHPDARTIHRTPDGRSLVPPPPGAGQHSPKSYLHIGERVAFGLLASTSGFLGHTEHCSPRNSPALVPLFRVSSTAAFLVLCGFFFDRSRRRRTKAFLLVCFASIVGYYLFYIYVQYRGWPAVGTVTAQGRYFIGYLHLAVLMLFVLASQQLNNGSLLKRAARNVVFWPCVVVLFMILCHPLFYLRNTMESYRKAGIEEIVKTELRAQGFEQLPISRWMPKDLFSDCGRQEYAPSYGLAYPDSTIGGEVVFPADGDHALEVAVWAQGDEALGEKAWLGISLFAPEAVDAQPASDSFSLQHTVDVGEEIEVYRTYVPLAGPNAPRESLYVRLLNQPVFQSRAIKWIWPRTRKVTIFGLYYRFVGCRYQEAARRPVSLAWSPITDVEIQEASSATTLRPTGPDACVRTDLRIPEGPGQTVLVLHADAAETTALHWFLNTGDGFHEEQSILQELAPGRGDLSLHLPADLQSLRLDPQKPLTILGTELVTYQWLPVN